MLHSSPKARNLETICDIYVSHLWNPDEGLPILPSQDTLKPPVFYYCSVVLKSWVLELEGCGSVVALLIPVPFGKVLHFSVLHLSICKWVMVLLWGKNEYTFVDKTVSGHTKGLTDGGCHPHPHAVSLLTDRPPPSPALWKCTAPVVTLCRQSRPHHVPT